MNWPRALVFTAIAPPSSAAAAQVLQRLTSGGEEQFGYVHQADNLPRKEMTSVHVPVEHDFGILSLPVLWRFEQFGWYHAATREGLRQITESKWDVIVACHPSMAFVLAAAKVASSSGLPMILYLMDIFAESRVNPFERFWAGIMEKKLMEQASTVICLTEGLKNYYSSKYKIPAVLIPHCVTEPEIAEAVAMRPDLEVGSPLIIAYAGGVYQARLDSLVVVNQAIEQLNAEGFPVQLLILGRNDPTRLAAWGIGGRHVRVRFIENRSEFMKQLRCSDILLSTIGFETPYPLQDQTCFPTKTFDYFLAGKPVLVVAPDRADYVSYMKKNTSAMVITALNSDIIAKHIYQLAMDMSLRKQLAASGFKILGANIQAFTQESLHKVLIQSVKPSCL